MNCREVSAGLVPDADALEVGALSLEMLAGGCRLIPGEDPGALESDDCAAGEDALAGVH